MTNKATSDQTHSIKKSFSSIRTNKFKSIQSFIFYIVSKYPSNSILKTCTIIINHQLNQELFFQEPVWSYTDQFSRLHQLGRVICTQIGREKTCTNIDGKIKLSKIRTVVAFSTFQLWWRMSLFIGLGKRLSLFFMLFPKHCIVFSKYKNSKNCGDKE